MVGSKGYYIDNEIVISNKGHLNTPTLEKLKKMVFNGEIEEVFFSHYLDNRKSNLERESIENVRRK